MIYTAPDGIHVLEMATKKTRLLVPFRPEPKKVDGINKPDFIQPGMFRAEHLVVMSRHNYKLEPNVRFSPDKLLVLFTSNMFGPSYVFGVETAKAVNPKPEEVLSTPAIAAKIDPIAKPGPTPGVK